MSLLTAPVVPGVPLPKFFATERVIVREETGALPGTIIGDPHYDTVYRVYFYPVLIDDGNHRYRLTEPESHLDKRAALPQ